MSAQLARRLLLAAILLALPVAAAAVPLGQALAAERARPAVAPLPREDFVVRTTLSSVTLSPDGRQVAWLLRSGDERSLWVRATTPGAIPRRLLRRVEANDIFWAPDSRWLLLVGTDAVRVLAMAGQAGSGMIATLGGATHLRVQSLDPWQAGVVLLDEQDGKWRLWRAGIGGTRRMIAWSPREIVDAAIDRDGHARFAKLVEGDHHAIVARTPNGHFRTVARCVRLERCDLLAMAGDGVWLASDAGLTHRALLTLGADGARHVVDSDQLVDLDGVVMDRRTATPTLLRYGGTAPRSAGLAPSTRSALAGLARAGIGGSARIEVSAGPWLIAENDGRLPGQRWQLFDPRDGRVMPLLDDPGQRRRIPAAQLARTIAVAFRASDGMTIHGLLTVPPGRDLASAPLTTIVHGGPWSHDEPGYSATTQLLANRGHIVFRPQFRGSTGFGRAYMLAPQGDFGDGRVERDIEQGTRWLLAQGIGDPRRTAIVGASFGGYSVLQALSNGSQLYHVGIAIVPPADFGWVSRWMATRGTLPTTEGVTLATSLRLLGMDPADPAIARRLSEQSPRARIAAMRSPLLIIASGRDERVPLRSVLDYAARLRIAGADARIVVARKQPHASSDPFAQRAGLWLTEAMLARHLGGPPVAPPAPDLRQWIAANMAMH